MTNRVRCGASIRLWLGVVQVLVTLAAPARCNPPDEAMRIGAARKVVDEYKFTAADEAIVFTPPGFHQPGKPMYSTGQDTGRLKIMVRDKTTDKPTFCRMNVVGADGNYYQPAENNLTPFGLTADYRQYKHQPGKLPQANLPFGPIRYFGRFFYCSGEVAVNVPPGQVRIEVWKGFEYRPVALSIHVEAGQTQTAELTLERSLPIADYHYYSGDPHLHFRRESQADDDLILDLMEADEIRFGTILAYNDPAGPYDGTMQTQTAPQLRGLGPSSIRNRGDYHILSAQEYRSTAYGHLNLFMRDGLVLPQQQLDADDWPLYGALGNEVQKAGGFAFYAHGGFAQAVYADLVQGNVDGVELLQFAVYFGMGLEDWYHVLNCGFRFPITGASDYPWCRALGDCKTYVQIGGDPDFRTWLQGAAEGRSFVTTGPMLLLEVDEPAGGAAAKPGAPLRKSGNGPHRLNARIRVRSEVAPVTNVQLIVNGVVVQELETPLDQGEGRWLTLERPLDLTESSWIAARAFSKAPTGAPNAESHTNPVFVYLDGKAPYQQASLDRLVECVDRQIAFHKSREFSRKTDVLAYFERSRDILMLIRAAGEVPADGHPSDIARDARAMLEDPGARAHSDTDLKEFLKPIPPKKPIESLKTMEIVEGFRMELVAHEPLVRDPIAAEFDENGQLYVCEMCDYPYRPKPGEKPLGTVRLLRDVNGDGVFDDSHVFADELLWPSGVAPWDGGVFVASAPDIWYLKDTDGDFRADVRTKVFTGFGTQNQQGMLNNLRFGLDHKVYGATGPNGGTIRTGNARKSEIVLVSGRDFRFDPRELKLETITGTIQFGNTFDDLGNRFVCSEAQPLLHVVLPQRYLARNPHLPVPSAINNIAIGPVPIFRISPTERWRQVRSNRLIAHKVRPATADGVSHHVVDAAAGVTVYRGAAYPKEYYSNVFVSDAQNNLIHRRTLTSDGVTFQSKRADENTEFVRSSDNWFRPVNLVNAPDGTLYVLDMSREIIESIHIPSDVAKHLDLTRGRDQGRIYRLAPPGFVGGTPPRLGDATAAELVAALENPNGWWRDTAHRLIYQRQDLSCVSPLRAMLGNSKLPQARLLALWSLHGLDALTDDDLAQSLSDPSSDVREHAIRLTESRLGASPSLLDLLLKQAEAPDARIGFQLAFTLGETQDGRAVDALSQVARRHAADPWIRTAVLSSAANVAHELFLKLVADSDFVVTPEGLQLLSRLAQVVGARNRADEVTRLLEALGTHTDSTNGSVREAIVLGLGDGLKQSGSRLPDPNTLPPPGNNVLLKLIGDATGTALNPDANDDQRRRAIELLGCLEFAKSQPALMKLLDQREPQSIQLAALDALSEYGNDLIAQIVLEGWNGYLPAVRTRASRMLLSREQWTEAYLAAVLEGRASVAEIDAAGRTQLLQHQKDSIRLAAEKLLRVHPRATVFADYRSVLEQPGDSSLGEKIFDRECSACHRIIGKGHEVGPDLMSSPSRDAEALLTNILDPNRQVNPAYLQYLIVVDSGRTVTGMISAETATSITLTRGEGVSETILRETIDELQCTDQSLMPEGFERKISKVEMADLIAFLSGLNGVPEGDEPRMNSGTQPGLIEP